MSNVKRVFVEKKPEFAVAAKALRHEIRHYLGIRGVSGVRVLNRYDVEDITDEAFEAAEKTIFSEPPVDNVYIEKFKCEEDEIVFGMEYLPGQYDQRADSAMQCIQIITGDDKAVVAAAKIYVLKGRLSVEDVEKIKNYCINPVDSREASMDKPDTLKMNLNIPETVEILKGIVQNIKPKLIIVIDALASRSIDRISSTIQISDTGIVPGAGVGNTRQEISERSLGIPVVSMGIPTVVELATLVSDGIDI